MRYQVGTPYNWGKDIVVPVQDYGDYALVKIIKSDRFQPNTVRQVLWNQLSGRKAQPTSSFISPKPYNSCPTCGTNDQISGISCPGCGFKEWLKTNWN